MLFGVSIKSIRYKFIDRSFDIVVMVFVLVVCLIFGMVVWLMMFVSCMVRWFVVLIDV